MGYNTGNKKVLEPYRRYGIGFPLSYHKNYFYFDNTVMANLSSYVLIVVNMWNIVGKLAMNKLILIIIVELLQYKQIHSTVNMEEV